MTHKEIAQALTDMLDGTNAIQNIRAFIRELDLPRPEPGTVVEDERDRLREALDVLAEEYAAKLKVSAASVKESAFEIAAERKALQEAGDE